MKKLIEKLIIKHNNNIITTNDFNVTIKTLQTICEHKHPDDSNAIAICCRDGYVDYYQCTLCGKKENHYINI